VLPPVVVSSVAEVEATTLSRPVAPVSAADATLVFAPPPKARLVGVLGPLVGQSIPVPEHGAFMGRATNADLVVSDAQVSGRHAWIGFVDGKLVLRDQGSTNGTFLNDDLRQPVSETALKAGDVIVLGRQASVKFMVAID
jgi:pSer/pThr/pTyr-binding forkhead associated (FHA) protein